MQQKDLKYLRIGFNSTVINKYVNKYTNKNNSKAKLMAKINRSKEVKDFAGSGREF
jgi:hypothetical protein